MIIDDDQPQLQPLTDAETMARAARIKLVATDVDGVLTDAGVYYSDSGEAMKRFSLRDGMGVERLRNDGIETAFITRENSPVVVRRAQKLNIRLCYLGVADKAAALPTLLAEAGVTADEVAYIGDDVNDSAIMAAIGPTGLLAAPADAFAPVLRNVHYRCAQPGGHGAFRDFAEWILGFRKRMRRST
jgi:3-deoxy-D-manno-octulosonate 8-phosphate phosphatase (KDO 8-P phosphatase)